MTAPLASAESLAAGEGQGGLFGWYRRADGAQRRAFWSCKLGFAMDAMDTQFLSFVIPTLIAVWGITTADAGLIGTVTLLSSAVGGWIAGILSDRIGRVKALQITILWFSVFTLACAFAQDYWQLLIARALMGLGFGGEWTAGAVLIGEVIRREDRGKAVGTVQAGWALGWAVAAGLYTLIFSLAPPETAWRLLFAIGILPAPFVIFIRRLVQEPEIHKRQRIADQARGERSSMLAIFGKGVWWTTLRASLLATGVQGGYYAVATWLPTYLKAEKGLSVVGTGGYLAVVIAGSYPGYLLGAYLSDRFGRRRTFILFALGSMLMVLLYTRIPISDGWLLLLGFPLGFGPAGIFAGMGPFLTELFPTRIRGSGQGFSYNFGRAIGSTFPFLIGFAATDVPLSTAIGAFAAGAYSLVILAAVTLPETRGRDLEREVG